VKSTFRFALALVLVLAMGLVTATPVAAATINVPADYPTIQEAINAANPGDIIAVAAGTYNESIVVDKSLTLIGAQANVDPRPSIGGRSGPETIIVNASTALSIRAHNVVVNGFTFESHISSSSPNVVEAIGAEHPQILYNIVYNTNPGGASNEGIKVRTSFDSGAVVSYNYVYDIPKPGDAINFDTVNGGIISYNEVRNIGSDNAAIYIYNSLSTTIERNLVDTTTRNDGIKLGNKGGQDAGKTGGFILGNTVRNTAQDGITVYMSDVVVAGNDVSGSTSENGAIYLAFGISNVTITDNCVQDNNLRTHKHADAAGILLESRVEAATVAISNNNIEGNTPCGVTNKAAGTLDARENWWGDASGPSGVGTGTGDAVSLNVNFAEWLTSPAAGTPCSPPLDDEGPVTSHVMADPNPAPVGVAIALTATIDDTETGGSNIASAEYSLDGGANWEPMDAADGAFDSPVEHVIATIGPFDEPTVIEILVRGTDAAGNTGEPEPVLVAVYDPEAGFVTGGGWIWSPEGAYAADPDMTGKATFGFVSRYQRGRTTPDGNTQFQFRAADLNFRSTEYEWLVIAGHRAQYKGSGTINGEGDYGFMLTAIDGNLTSSQDYDSFRIKIWDKSSGDVVYDNQMGKSDTGDDATELGGGSIVIHSGGGSGKR